jgi:dTDP-4-amino-4,6-dideoxygalactose transaminase
LDFLPYVKHLVTPADIAAVVRVLASDRLTQGPEVEALESALLKHLDMAGPVVACSSGTAALHLAMMAMGVKPGDRVITTPMTFCATANAIVMCGGRPKFVDVDPLTLNLDLKLVELALEERKGNDDAPVGILAVHYAGRPCDMRALREIANRHHVWLVEDACHALGARFSNGVPVGAAYANATCFSFHPAKHVAAGEGGAVVVPEGGPVSLLRQLRDHGRRAAGHRGMTEMNCLGYNYRMDEMSAALARSQLGRLDTNIVRLQYYVSRYLEKLGGLPSDVFRCPPWDQNSAWHLFSCWVRDRYELREHLEAMGIGTQVHYQPVHLQPYYQQEGLGCEGLCPVAEEAYRHQVSLPLFASMTKNDVLRVCAAVEEFYG